MEVGAGYWVKYGLSERRSDWELRGMGTLSITSHTAAAARYSTSVVVFGVVRNNQDCYGGTQLGDRWGRCLSGNNTTSGTIAYIGNVMRRDRKRNAQT